MKRETDPQRISQAWEARGRERIIRRDLPKQAGNRERARSSTTEVVTGHPSQANLDHSLPRYHDIIKPAAATKANATIRGTMAGLDDDNIGGITQVGH